MVESWVLHLRLWRPLPLSMRSHKPLQNTYFVVSLFIPETISDCNKSIFSDWKLYCLPLSTFRTAIVFSNIVSSILNFEHGWGSKYNVTHVSVWHRLLSVSFHILYIRILTAKQARLCVTGASFCQVYHVDKKPKSCRKHFLIENEDPCLAGLMLEWF